MAGWSPENRALAWRLSIAAVLIALTVLGALLVRRAGVWLPWWVPVMAFAVIVIAAVARARETADSEPPDEPGDNDGPYKF
jgi:hypothetical protein